MGKCGNSDLEEFEIFERADVEVECDVEGVLGYSKSSK
jgi:hypothetical protein